MHAVPGAQSLGPEQLVRHASVEAQVYAPHDAGTTIRQVPPPLQVRAGIDVPPLQAAPAQTVPLAYGRQAPAPSHVPSFPQLAAPSSAHWFSGSVPAGTSMHWPSLPAIAHDRQVPLHAVEQQTPCAQNPEAQSPAVAHAAPGGFGPQLPFTQAAPPTQSALLAQSARQALPALLHMYGPQPSLVTAPHEPAPSQRPAWLTVDVEQDCARQIVPAAYSAHDPVPSHEPSRPQLAMPSSGQSLRGSAPTGTLVHVPTLPSTAHDWQAPEQSERQQTPSEQKPLLQSPAVRHSPPASASASCPRDGAPAVPVERPSPPLPDAPNISPPPPHAPHASATTKPATMLLERTNLAMHRSVSGIRALGRRMALLKDERWTCERAYRSSTARSTDD
jgi:hypothetical protein